MTNVALLLKPSKLTAFRRYVLRTPGIKYFYTFNEPTGNLVDIGPNRLTATKNGTVTQGQPGKLGNSISFNNDGNNSVTLTGVSVTLPFSLIVVVKPITSFDNNDRVIDKADGGPANGFYILMTTTGNLWKFEVWNNTSQSMNNSIGGIDINSWQMLGASIQSSSGRTFKNGVFIEEDTSVVMTAQTASAKVGARATGTINAFRGQIQHLAIFDRAISDARHAKFARLCGF